MENNGKLAAELMVERARPIQSAWYDIFWGFNDKCVDMKGFSLKIQSIINRVNQENAKLSAIKFDSIIGEVLNAARVHHVKIESDFTCLFVSLMVLEGIGRQLNPDLNLFSIAKPLLQSTATKQLWFSVSKHICLSSHTCNEFNPFL